MRGSSTFYELFLVTIVVAVPYFFFGFGKISDFSFGGASMSLYLVYMIFRKNRRRRTEIASEASFTTPLGRHTVSEG